LERAEEEQRNIAAGNPGDVDFIGLVKKWRQEHANDAMSIESGGAQPKICIAVRKRPVFEKERARKDHDSVTCHHPVVWVHSAKLKVDGITKYLDHSSFCFDYGFSEKSSTEDVYQHCTMPLVDFTCSGKGGRATVFAYGQTGSGKTYTMNGIEAMVAEDIFYLLSKGVNTNLDNTMVLVSFFEIYGGRIQDLLNKRNRLKVLEDGKGEVVVTGLLEFEANNPKHLLEFFESAQK
jgi:kinesin family protein 2/24